LRRPPVPLGPQGVCRFALSGQKQVQRLSASRLRCQICDGGVSLPQLGTAFPYLTVQLGHSALQFGYPYLQEGYQRTGVRTRVR
jgi:hypothetical protein